MVEPVTISSTTVFQDAAIISWDIDGRLSENLGFEISWTDGTDSGTARTESGARSYTIEGLKARTTYRIGVTLILSDHQKFSTSARLLTKVYRDGTYPFIYLTGTQRNVDGSFPAGAKIPLRIFNATGVAGVEWYLGDERIETGDDGYYTITRGGTLKAVIMYEDGSTEQIIKEISIR